MVSAKKNALVVEDTNLFRELLRKFLMELNVDVITAGNGQKALVAIDENPKFDVIITDWKMPEMDGLEFVKKVREIPDYADIPIIMVTSENEAEKVRNAIISGVNDFLIKPCNMKSLRVKLEKMKIL